MTILGSLLAAAAVYGLIRLWINFINAAWELS